MQFEHLDPSSLKPHPQNSRVHSEDQLQQLVASIERFGFNGAIVIDEDGVILAGHGRTQAMIRLGRPTIPCVRKLGLSDVEKRTYVIADNQIGLNSEWDDEVLQAELAALVGEGLDLHEFGIDPGALVELEHAPVTTAAGARALEGQTDTAPPLSEEEFEREMARADTTGLLPIVPMYAEHHEAFIIVCDNAVDEAWLRNRLGLEHPMQSYKDVKSQRANVLTVQQLKDRWK
jgi:ParB-like chromosome segregation protein Spo0J